MACAEFNIELKYAHIRRDKNVTGDLLSRWKNSEENIKKLQKLVPNAVWEKVDSEFLTWDLEI